MWNSDILWESVTVLGEVFDIYNPFATVHYSIWDGFKLGIAGINMKPCWHKTKVYVHLTY